MQNFQFYINTNVFFGKGEIQNLGREIKSCGQNILLVYGGGSIKKTGLYDTVIDILNSEEINITEFGSVEPNPTVATAKKGIAICREKKIDGILCVGGGSVIDCGKAIAAGTYYDGSPWDLVCDPEKIKKALPIITVVTMAAAGSEMDEYAVLTNEATFEKKSMHSLMIRPKVSIMDPEYTYTVPKCQTAAGVADIMSHLLDCYFKVVPGAYLQERVIEALLITCLEYGPVVMESPDDYDARANLMWASSWAVNGMVSKGFAGQSPVHPIEHPLSARYNVTHGAGLAVLTPNWMRFILETKEDALPIFVKYARNVWKIEDLVDDRRLAELAIEKTADFFKKLSLPSTLRELGIQTKEHFNELAEIAVKAGASKAYFSLNKKEIVKIYEMSF